MPRSILFFLLALLGVSPLHAESRTWRNADGSRTFTGEYVSHDTRRVTIRRADGRVFTLELTQLHADDQAWLKQKNIPGPAANSGPPPVEGAIFDNLKFGDSHTEVMAKLRASKAVELTIPETYLARMGLNGSFRTRQQIGGLHCLLFFDWDENSKLNELTLQTEPQDEAAYAKELKATWTELAKLVSSLHGPPASASTFPAASQLTEDRMILNSHLWKTEDGLSVLLGTARDSGRYSVSVRFTTAAIAPAAPAAPTP